MLDGTHIGVRVCTRSILREVIGLGKLVRSERIWSMERPSLRRGMSTLLLPLCSSRAISSIPGSRFTAEQERTSDISQAVKATCITPPMFCDLLSPGPRPPTSIFPSPVQALQLYTCTTLHHYTSTPLPLFAPFVSRTADYQVQRRPLSRRRNPHRSPHAQRRIRGSNDGTHYRDWCRHCTHR